MVLAPRVFLLPVPDANGAKAPETSSKTTLRDALSLMLTEGSSGVVVRGDDGAVQGYLTFDVVSRLLSATEDERVT